MSSRFDATERVVVHDPLLASDSGLRAGSDVLPARPGKTLKRFVDLASALVGLVLGVPAFVLIALAIKFQDGGPIIYRRRVVGQHAEFDAFKFRSMRPDADNWLHANPVLWAEFQQNFKLKNDPRVTPVGHWLRKTSLDELPQLFNVLRGEMSLVGPRMITADELEKYGDARHLLLSVRPGLTGLWQVEGRQTTSYEERVRMDIAYITKWSVMLDLKILLKTPIAVLRARGAY